MIPWLTMAIDWALGWALKALKPLLILMALAFTLGGLVGIALALGGWRVALVLGMRKPKNGRMAAAAQVCEFALSFLTVVERDEALRLLPRPAPAGYADAILSIDNALMGMTYVDAARALNWAKTSIDQRAAATRRGVSMDRTA